MPMKRLHVHVSVDDLAPSIRFYSTLFAAEPTVRKSDYAKWMLDDPRVNFAISQRGRGRGPGLDHLGIQVESEGELREVYGRLQAAEAPVLEVGATTCCYAKSEKAWIVDPQGLSWETFLTSGESTVYGHGSGGELAEMGARRAAPASQAASTSCCAPSAEQIVAVGPAKASGCCAAAAAE
jgi:catechol 2,3-dioxygenase-like lactoylglutathione lyase family enzyme